MFLFFLSSIKEIFFFLNKEKAEAPGHAKIVACLELCCFGVEVQLNMNVPVNLGWK